MHKAQAGEWNLITASLPVTRLARSASSISAWLVRSRTLFVAAALVCNLWLSQSMETAGAWPALLCTTCRTHTDGYRTYAVIAIMISTYIARRSRGLPEFRSLWNVMKDVSLLK